MKRTPVKQNPQKGTKIQTCNGFNCAESLKKQGGGEFTEIWKRQN